MSQAVPSRVRLASIALTSVLFVILFAQPMMTLGRDWWNNPDAGHGLLLAPLALWLAWRKGIRPDARPNLALGIALIAGAVLLRYVSSLAAEQFTSRASLLMALGGLVTLEFGFRQLLWWWLPSLLLILSIPLPDVVLSGLALPLQFKASQLGAELLSMRGVPVRLDGNVIQLPGHSLFVTEACSGLRSLTALLSLGVLLGGLMLQSPVTRVLLVALSIPVAVVINGIRVFLTGFLVLFVDPAMGEGFTHLTEGWLMFVVAFAVLGALTWVMMRVERRVQGRGAHA
ncbi:MAG TPA: exosortase/archaeosortase family protein [Gemmatimonadaceae bacterium]|nr:exosortase/archaeosortase family protein [Gemmatimonadaceae bacterium]